MADDGTIQTEESSPMPTALSSSELTPSNDNDPENISTTEAPTVAFKRTRRGGRGARKSKESMPKTEAKLGVSAGTFAATTTDKNTGTSDKLKHLVVDSGAIIKGAGINLASTSEVIMSYVFAVNNFRSSSESSCLRA